MFKFGIDWSEDHHNLCVRNDKGAIVSQIEFKHTLEGFQRFDDERRKLGVPASECLVAIETAYNLLVDFLLDRSYVVYLVPASYISSRRPSRGEKGTLPCHGWWTTARQAVPSHFAVEVNHVRARFSLRF